MIWSLFCFSLLVVCGGSRFFPSCVLMSFPSLSRCNRAFERVCASQLVYVCFSSYASNRLLCLQREMIWHSNSAPPSLALSRFLLYQCLPRFCDSSEKPSQTQFSHSSSCHYHILITFFFFKEGPGVK